MPTKKRTTPARSSLRLKCGDYVTWGKGGREKFGMVVGVVPEGVDLVASMRAPTMKWAYLRNWATSRLPRVGGARYGRSYVVAVGSVLYWPVSADLARAKGPHQKESRR